MARVGKRVAKSTRGLIDELEPSVRRAWRASVKELANNVNFSRLVKAIERRDLKAADEALNLDGAFDSLDRALRRSFEAGGKMTTKIISEEAARHG